MRKIFFVAGLILVVFLSGPVCAKDLSGLDEVYVLGEENEYKKIILSIPEEQYKEDKPKYIALHPDTKQVTVTPQKIKYTEEAESFAGHRRHYVAFWSIFMVMFGIDILWAE